MKCTHCGSEWTTTTNNTKTSCPFCGKQLESNNNSQPAARGQFQLSYDKTTLVQFLGDEINVVIPAGITRIGAGAFRGYGVETVYIPDGVIEIGDNCFNGCKNLREIRIPTSVSYISDSAFKDAKQPKIITQKESYAWKKYAKQVTETKSAATNTQPNVNPVEKPTPTSPPKPTEVPKKFVASTHIEPAKKPLVDEVPSVDKLIDDKFGKTQIMQNKYTQWATLLGCNPGEKPWIIKSSLFVSADKRAQKIIARIKNIHDQELLARIEEETNDGRVRLAAVENITDQNRLFSVVNDTRNPNIRRAAIERITNQNLLNQLANNKNEEVRNLVFLRIASPSELKKHLMTSINKQDVSALSRISTSDMLDLALSAKCENIRIAAADMLPATSAEGNLLKAATAFSKKITMEGIVHYDEAHVSCQKANPDFLQKIAKQHPDPCVRYLARGRKNVEAKGNSFEEQMKSQTLSQRELTLREVDARCKHLQNLAYNAVQSFIEQCKKCAANGQERCDFKTSVWTYWVYPKDLLKMDEHGRCWEKGHFVENEEKEFFISLLERNLRRNNIVGAHISTSGLYERKYVFDEGTSSSSFGYAFIISTRW